MLCISKYRAIFSGWIVKTIRRIIRLSGRALDSVSLLYRHKPVLSCVKNIKDLLRTPGSQVENERERERPIDDNWFAAEESGIEITGLIPT